MTSSKKRTESADGGDWRPESPVTVLRGVGPVRARRLAEAGIRSLGDLARQVPARWEDRRSVVPVAGLTEPGVVTVEGRIVGLRRTPTRRRGLRLVRGAVEDASGRLPAIWFNRPFLAASVDPTVLYRLHGAVRPGRSGAGGLQLVNASVEAAAEADRRVVPVYRPIGELGPAAVARLVGQVVDGLDLTAGIVDGPADELSELRGLPRLGEALLRLHRPRAADDVEELNEGRSRGHLRLAYGDLLRLQVRIARRRRTWKGRRRVCAYRIPDPPESLGESWLPFRLTGAQRRTFREIARDLRSPRPMLRLLQGDVGCGKTAVAALALAAAVRSGHQAALMAPTEILAEQHHDTLTRLFGGEFEVGCLTSGSEGRERLLERLAAGEVPVVVGTHALVQESVRFARLALVVIDEQHRFGVEQRRRLLGKAERPDVLVMTATPIPRSLALAVYGDLDLSVIDELPPGRAPVRTRTAPALHRPRLLSWLARRVAAGERAYVVFPRIDGEDAGEMASIVRAEEAYRAALPPGCLEVLHGRIDRRLRGEILARFAGGETAVLLATTLVEVGLDVPDATVMVIEGAERFGLAQLHQLRGRVGRGGRPAVCVALHGELGETAESRLRTFAETRDGFVLAEADLEIRGPGELLGRQQAGTKWLAPLRLASDGQWLRAAREDARRWVGSPDVVGGRRSAVALEAGG